MKSYLLRRIAGVLVTLWAAVSLNFLLPRMMPGDPASRVINQIRLHTGSEPPPQTIRAIHVILGDPTANIFSQYIQYWRNLSHLNFGVSTSQYPTPVIDLIARALPWSLFLVVTSTLAAWTIGSALGLLAGWNRGRASDIAITLGATLAISLPSFWIALIILWVFGYALHWFPFGGGYSPEITATFSLPFALSAIYHAILPAITLIVTSFAGWVFNMRNMAVTTILEDYVLLGQAKGLSRRSILWTYIGRNAILPNVTGLAQAVGYSFGGALLVELVFTYPGLGALLLEAVTKSDFPLMQALFLLVTIFVLTFNFLADWLNLLIDPRTRAVVD
jgi:peptide/nickel transport system permease protein